MILSHMRIQSKVDGDSLSYVVGDVTLAVSGQQHAGCARRVPDVGGASRCKSSGFT